MVKVAILFFSAYSYKWPFLSWLRLFKAPVHWDNRLCILNKKGYHHGIITTGRLLLSEKREGEWGERWKTAWLISCYCLLDQEGRGKAEKGGNWLLSASLKPQNMRYLCRWKSICVIYWTYLLERTVKMLTQNLILSVLDTDKRILKGDTKNSDYTEPWGCLPNS